MNIYLNNLISVMAIGLWGLNTVAAQGHTGHVHEAHEHPEHAHEAHDHAHHSSGEQPDYGAAFAQAQPSHEIVIEQCWVRWLPGDVPAAGYFELHNQTNHPVELLAARSAAYDLLMLHQSYEEDGLLKMKMADAIVIPADDSLSFVPGGYHLMLEEPTQKVQVGDRIEIEFLLKPENKESHVLVNSQCRVNSPKARQYDESSEP